MHDPLHTQIVTFVRPVPERESGMTSPSSFYFGEPVVTACMGSFRNTCLHSEGKLRAEGQKFTAHLNPANQFLFDFQLFGVLQAGHKAPPHFRPAVFKTLLSHMP